MREPEGKMKWKEMLKANGNSLVHRRTRGYRDREKRDYTKKIKKRS